MSEFLLKKRFVLVALLFVLLSVSSCIKKKAPPPPAPAPDPLVADSTPVEEPLSIQTVPNRASVKLSTGETCTSPCTLKKMSTETFDVTAEKSGYRTATVTVISHAQVVPGSGSTGHPILERPKLQPNPVRLTLEPSWKKR